MRRQVAINQCARKRESRLNDKKTASEKVSVLAHGRDAVIPNSMSTHTTLGKRDFGDRASETWFRGNVVESVTMLTAGGRQ